MATPRRKLGDAGEEAVVKWLVQQRFTLLARNYTTRMGEIDLIVAKDDVIAFVEVKTRYTHYFPISEVITTSKQRKIISAAKHFILQNNFHDKVYRFDVATVIATNNEYLIEYLPNAFGDQ